MTRFALTQASRERFGVQRAEVEAGLRDTAASSADSADQNWPKTGSQHMSSVGFAIGLVVGRPPSPGRSLQIGLRM